MSLELDVSLLAVKVYDLVLGEARLGFGIQLCQPRLLIGSVGIEAWSFQGWKNWLRNLNHFFVLRSSRDL